VTDLVDRFDGKAPEYWNISRFFGKRIDQRCCEDEMQKFEVIFGWALGSKDVFSKFAHGINALKTFHGNNLSVPNNPKISFF